MKKMIFFIMILTIVSKVAGFTKDIVLAYFYGASSITDAYLISLTIPNVILGMVGAGISTAYIPMYSKIEAKLGGKEANAYTNNLINLVLVLCTVILIISLIFTKPIVRVFASGFDGGTLDLAILFTRISLIGIYSVGLSHSLIGYLQLKSNYVIPALIGIPMNFIIVVSIAISSQINVVLLSLGSTIAIISQIVILAFYARKQGYKYKPVLNVNDSNMKNMIYLALPVILGSSVSQINQLVDRTLASQITTGGISALSYAHKLDSFIQSIFVVSIITVLYPTISKMAANNDIEGLKKSTCEAISGVSLFVIPCTIGAMIFAEPVVSLLFGRGAFDLEAITLTSYALFFYSIGMIGIGVKKILARAFYSLQDTKTPMINSTVAVLTNIILNIILSKFLGIGGLALATSISAIFSMLLMFTSLRKKIGPFGIKRISISFIKILFASLIMGILAKYFFQYLKTNIFSQNISLILSMIIGTLIYFIIIYFMKIEDVDIVTKALRAKLMGKRYMRC